MSLDLFVYAPELPADIEQQWASAYRSHTSSKVLAGPVRTTAPDNGAEIALRMPVSETDTENDTDDWRGLLVTLEVIDANQRDRLMELAKSQSVRQSLAKAAFEIHISAYSGVGDVSFFDAFWGAASLAEAAGGVFNDPQEGGFMTGSESIKWVREFVEQHPDTFEP